MLAVRGRDCRVRIDQGERIVKWLACLALGFAWAAGFAPGHRNQPRADRVRSGKRAIAIRRADFAPSMLECE
jgi:hypothetical protein